MTKRKRWAAALAGIVMVGVAAFCLWLYSTCTAITEDSAVRIRAGMTLAEVETILGGPARDESTGPLVADLTFVGDDRRNDAREPIDPIEFCTSVRRELVDGGRGEGSLPAAGFWLSNRAMIRVDFGASGRVERARWLPARRDYGDTLDRFRAWLGL
jgi:hypothetical protein